MLDIDKVVLVSVDLSKLSNVVKNDVVKKDVYNAKIKIWKIKYLITNVATKTTLDAKINEVKEGIPSITKLAATAVLNAKINEVKGEIPSITKLATTAALNSIENKIPNISNLVKKN